MLSAIVFHQCLVVFLVRHQFSCNQFRSLHCVNSIVIVMPCARCGQWVSEYITWRCVVTHSEVHCPHVNYFSTWPIGSSQRWFFFCSRCRRHDYMLRSWYINRDGWASSDSEDSADLIPVYTLRRRGII